MGEDRSRIETEPWQYGLVNHEGSPQRIVRPLMRREHDSRREGGSYTCRCRSMPLHRAAAASPQEIDVKRDLSFFICSHDTIPFGHLCLIYSDRRFIRIEFSKENLNKMVEKIAGSKKTKHWVNSKEIMNTEFVEKWDPSFNNSPYTAYIAKFAPTIADVKANSWANNLFE